MSNDGRSGRRLTGIEPLALGLVVVLFAAHLVFGANRFDLALGFAVPQFLLLLGLIAFSRGAEPPRLPLTWPAVLIGVVFALGVLSILPVGPPLAHPLWGYAQAAGVKAPATISLQPLNTRIELVKLAGFVCVFLCAAAIGARREAAEAMGRYLTVAGILYCLWAGAAHVIDPRSVWGAPRPYADGVRMSASFFSANSAGTLFACLALFGLVGLLAPVLKERRAGERRRAADFLKAWPQGVLALLAFICLLVTQSRGGLLALAASALLVLATAGWMKSSKGSLTGGFLTAACLALTLGVAAFVIGGQHTAERFADTNPLTEDRMKIFTAYWPTIKASPWLGYGLGAFPSFNGLSMTASNAVALSPLGAAHNVYLQWLLQQGWPGALAMFGAIGLVLAAIVRGVGRRANQLWLGLACLGMAAVFLVHGLVDFAFEEPSLAAFFSAVLGLGFGLAERPASGRRRS